MTTNRIKYEVEMPISPMFVYIATTIALPAIILGRIVEGTYRWMKSWGSVVNVVKSSDS